MLDIGKKVYNHRPGKCRRIPQIEFGSEDIEIIDSKSIAFISSGLVYLPNDPNSVNYKGKIFFYDLNQKNSFNAFEVPIVGLENIDEFYPHGISSFILPDGTIRLFVVVHSKKFEHSIILLDFNEKKKQFEHFKTIRNEKFVRPNDIFATGETSFLLSNDGGAQTQIGNFLEVMTGFHQGSVVYYDGQKSTFLLENTVANGISLSRNGKTLFVSHINDEKIVVFNWDQANVKVTKIAEHSILTGCDNFYIDKHDNLWSGCHPNVLQCIDHLKDHTIMEKHAPSQVLRIKFSDNYKKSEIVEVFSDDGRFASASSSAAVFDSGKQILIGTVFRQLIHCDIVTPLDF